MSDVVVTVPKTFEFAGLRGLAAWAAEGDLPGDEWTGMESHFYMGGSPPDIRPGERVYVVCEGKLRGYAPLVRVETYGPGRFALVRRGGAVAVTIPEPVRGFQGYRYRWWARDVETQFTDWQRA
jgi:hypothetical protein